NNTPAPPIEDAFNNPLLETFETNHYIDPDISRHQVKREKQNQQWKTEVIPHLIRPYMEQKDTLQKRFSSALHWFNVLQDVKMQHIEEILTVTRCTTLKLDNGCPFLEDVHQIDMEEDDHEEEDDNPFSSPGPSGGSKKRPLDFSDEDVQPGNPFPDPVDAMENYVETLRSVKARPTKKSRIDVEEEDDYIEDPALRVPKQAPSSLMAALMALVCQHDLVLFLINMRSAGEKQHYVITLIKMFFQHIPLDFKVGIEYDIGCQTQRSAVKWNLLDRYLDRISFAISVFHAFGHQWASQIIYHLRKREGFGLTDGEGCERFWHSISKLIPHLRVSGTLDRQVNQDHSEILENLGAWLLRRSQHARQKHVASEAVLMACQHPEAFLRDQWKKQVEAQTKPLLLGQSKNAGEAVNELIRLCEQQDELKKHIHDDTLVKSDKISGCFKELTSKIRTKESALGVQERLRLQRWIKSEYITTLMKLRALKLRLRDRIRACKFELDRVKQSFHHQVNIKRHDSSITQLATKYNQLCDTLANLIKKKKAPARSVKGLFSLDVDDTIWEDVGLNEDDIEPPAWLADQAVRDGIKALLEHDRCSEEDICLRHKCCSMRF
ncbi:hypothetical protein H0H93_006354, partial [Arthromyces matolae]